MRIPVPATLLLVLSCAAASGCGESSPVVARVGRETITVDEFTSVARGVEAQYPGPPDSAKAALLEDLVKRTLLVEEARRRALLPDSMLLQLRRGFEDEVLVGALIERMAPRGVEVSDAEVQTFYGLRNTQAHIHVIFTPDRSTADAARAMVDRGEDFGAVADRFNFMGAMPSRGDLGFQAPGDLVAPLDDYLTKAPLGKVLGPTSGVSGGWFIARVTDRKPRVQEPLEVQAPRLREMLRQRKQRFLLAKAGQDLRRQYDVKLAEGAAQTLFMRYNRPPAPSDSSAPLSQNPPPPTPDEARRPLATYRGERGAMMTYTLAEAVEDLQNPQSNPPNFSVMPAVTEWIQDQVVRRVALIEARRRHLQEEPAVARLIDQRVNNTLLEAIYNSDVLSATGPVTQQDIAAAFERRRSSFIRLDQVHLLWADFPDSTTAFRAMQHAGHSGTLRDAVAMASANVQVHEERVRYPHAEPIWQMLQATFMGMAPKEYGGPFQVHDGWRMLQLLDKIQGEQVYDSLPPVFKQHLQAEALELKRERRLTELTNELRKTHPVVINQRVLARVPWPVTAPAPGA